VCLDFYFFNFFTVEGEGGYKFMFFFSPIHMISPLCP
jgi:hypothetical protein